MSYFESIPTVKYEGKESKNPFAFKFYDAERVIMGKKMKEHLPFAMAWWHNLCAAGTDMFGRDTADKSFGAEKEQWSMQKQKLTQVLTLCKSLALNTFAFTM